MPRRRIFLFIIIALFLYFHFLESLVPLQKASCAAPDENPCAHLQAESAIFLEVHDVFQEGDRGTISTGFGFFPARQAEVSEIHHTAFGSDPSAPG